MMHTTEVREIKITENGAFYRFLHSRSLVWFSMPLIVARRALRDGQGSWNGVAGPVIAHQENQNETAGDSHGVD